MMNTMTMLRFLASVMIAVISLPQIAHAQLNRPDSLQIARCKEGGLGLRAADEQPVPKIDSDSLMAIIHRTPPPLDADGRPMEGRVFVNFRIDETGATSRFEISGRQYHNSPILDSLALTLARSIAWYPWWTTCWGEPKAGPMSLPFTFKHRPVR